MTFVLTPMTALVKRIGKMPIRRMKMMLKWRLLGGETPCCEAPPGCISWLLSELFDAAVGLGKTLQCVTLIWTLLSMLHVADGRRMGVEGVWGAGKTLLRFSANIELGLAVRIANRFCSRTSEPHYATEALGPCSCRKYEYVSVG